MFFFIMTGDDEAHVEAHWEDNLLSASVTTAEDIYVIEVGNSITLSPWLRAIISKLSPWLRAIISKLSPWLRAIISKLSLWLRAIK